MPASVTLVTEDMAAYWTGRPGSTIRRWAAEGRVQRYGSGRGQVRYNLWDFPKAKRVEETTELIEPGATPPMPQRAPRAA